LASQLNSIYRELYNAKTRIGSGERVENVVLVKQGWSIGNVPEGMRQINYGGGSMLSKNKTSIKPDIKRIDFAATSSYHIGKMTAVVGCVFRKDGAETINTILEKLIKSDIEKNYHK